MDTFIWLSCLYKWSQHLFQATLFFLIKLIKSSKMISKNEIIAHKKLTPLFGNHTYTNGPNDYCKLLYPFPHQVGYNS